MKNPRSIGDEIERFHHRLAGVRSFACLLRSLRFRRRATSVALHGGRGVEVEPPGFSIGAARPSAFDPPELDSSGGKGIRGFETQSKREHGGSKGRAQGEHEKRGFAFSKPRAKEQIDSIQSSALRLSSSSSFEPGALRLSSSSFSLSCRRAAVPPRRRRIRRSRRPRPIAAPVFGRRC
ncbi:hypothetical protein NL676_033321 [Syzygium grande]|nr:hypothetical protein NL676_033321 [Syzygium grande]